MNGVIKDKVAVRHLLADLLYGKSDSGEINFNVDKKIFDEVIQEIKDGRPIFKTPTIEKFKTKNLLKIGE